MRDRLGVQAFPKVWVEVFVVQQIQETVRFLATVDAISPEVWH